jgi:Na+-transporting NADH:ubiquinone oxidoreductase subunit NqrD
VAKIDCLSSFFLDILKEHVFFYVTDSVYIIVQLLDIHRLVEYFKIL